MKRQLLARALLASAVVAAAIALASCDADSIVPTGRAQAPLSEKMLADIAAKNMDKDSPILGRIFKEEAEMEVWKKNRDGEYALLKTYPICRWSGDLGPKKKQGDRQAPEGFYTITPGQMNPNSNYYLAFNTGYPNSYDRAWGYTGSELMVHGDCSSRGCYAMTDEQIQEIYVLARESFFGGQKEFQLQAYPFRMTALNMAKHRNNPNFAFWKMLKEGYDHFSATHREPKVAVCGKRYVFDAVASDEASKPLSFDPKGKCPAYQLDKTIADAVLRERRQEQFKMAEYIANGVSTIPSRNGIDGGMNPVFLAKLSNRNDFDNNGRTYEVAGQVASNTVAPGALPRTPNPPTASAEVLVRPPQPPVSEPVVVARVPMPHPAPQPKEGEAPALRQRQTSIAGLIGNLFGGSKAEAMPYVPASEKQAAVLRGTNTELAAKLKRATQVHTASAPVSAVVAPAPKPRDTAPKVVAPTLASDPPAQQTARTEVPRAREPETPASNNGLLVGTACRPGRLIQQLPLTISGLQARDDHGDMWSTYQVVGAHCKSLKPTQPVSTRANPHQSREA